MNRWSERPRLAARFWSHLVLTIPVLAVAAIGVATPADATPRFTGQPASGIVAQARAAMASAGSVSASGIGTMNIEGIGQVTISETDYSGQTSGTQALSITPAHPTGIALPAASTVDVRGDVYTDANRSFWTSSAGLPPTRAAQLAGKWIEIPPSSPLYAQVADDLTMPSLVRDLFDARKYHKGEVRQVDGVRSIEVTYVNTGGDAGSAAGFIAVGGRHLPVSVTLGDLTLRLGSWGRSRAVSPPARSVPLSTLVPSSDAGGGEPV